VNEVSAEGIDALSPPPNLGWNHWKKSVATACVVHQWSVDLATDVVAPGLSTATAIVNTSFSQENSIEK
jgi:hypothetical protein